MAYYFSEAETLGLRPELVKMLDFARFLAQVPFVLTATVESGPPHVENSAHEGGFAVDIRVRCSNERFKVLNGLILAGFKRIGIYDLHIHVDIDPSKPQNVIWTGKSA